MSDIKDLSDERYGIESGIKPSGIGTSSINGSPFETPFDEIVDEPEEDGPPTWWMILRELTETIVLSLIIFLLMRQVVQNYRIESHSMEPNFIEGQFILVNKLAYTLGEPSRGDVLVFHNPSNNDEDYIKRLIALPGDTLEIKDQSVYINGEQLDEPFIANKISPGRVHPPVEIQPGNIFVMGDNRPNSQDSRAFGQISQDLVVGQAWLRVWPLDVWGFIKHYELEPGVATEME